MKYQEFVNYVILEVKRQMGQEILGNGLELEVWSQDMLDGIVLRGRAEDMSPVLILNDFYKRYQSGIPMENILEDVIRHLQSFQKMELPGVKRFYDFKEVEDRVIFQLMRVAGNEALLEEVPHIRFLDLAIVFYLLFSKDHRSRIVALIHKEHSGIWQVNEQDLYKLAKRNTPRLLPEIATNLENWVTQMINQEGGDRVPEISAEEHYSVDSFLYLVTNNMNMYGAACILYDGVLKKLSEKLGSDLYLLPSSVHEFLAVPHTAEFTLEELRVIVNKMNRTEVQEPEVLSDHIYLYSRRNEQIVIAA